MTDKKRRGCLLVNSALEMAPYDPEFRKVVVQELTYLEAFFQRCVAAGQQDGTITARKVAYETLAKVREAMGLEPLWAGLVQATQARAEARKRPFYQGGG